MTTKKEKLEMRDLTGDDLFLVMSVVDKLEMVDDLGELLLGGSQEVQDMRNQITLRLVEQGVKEEDITPEMIMADPAAAELNASIMPKLIKIVIKNVPKAKKEINSLLANLCGVEVAEIKKLSLSAYVGLVKDFFKQPELGKLLELVNELI